MNNPTTKLKSMTWIEWACLMVAVCYMVVTIIWAMELVGTNRDMARRIEKLLEKPMEPPQD